MKKALTKRIKNNKLLSFLDSLEIRNTKKKYLGFLFFGLIFKLFDVFFNIRSLLYSSYPTLILVYFFIVIAIGCIAIGLINNFYYISFATCIWLAILLLANWIKSYFMSEPFYLYDLLLLKDTGEIVNFVTISSVSMFILHYIIPTLILIVIVSYYLKYMKKYFNFKFYQSIFKQLLILILGLGLSFVLLFPNQKTNHFILHYLFSNTIQDDYHITYQNSLSYYKKLGIVLGSYHNLINSYKFAPENYNESKINQEFKKYENKQNNNQLLGEPNIIVIFSESFWNPDNLPNIEFSQSVMPNFDYLSSIGKKVNLVSPSFGGSSANVEFELLTGLSLNYFAEGYIPYVSLYNKDKAVKYPSLIKELQNNDYTVEILNTAGENLYDCKSVYANMKIDNVLFAKTNNPKRKYATDKDVTDLIIDRFNRKNENEKLFYFAITMGAHMPYLSPKYSNSELYLTKSTYNKKINNVITNYALAINAADQELKRINDYINSLSEPTLVIFFGDHLPFLKTKDNINIYSETKYFKKGLEGLYQKYNTQALIFANYDISSLNQPTTISTDMLLNNVLNNSSLKLSPYYQWLYENQDSLGASNSYLTKKGDYLYSTKNLPQDIKSYYQLRENMQYKLLK